VLWREEGGGTRLVFSRVELRDMFKWNLAISFMLEMADIARFVAQLFFSVLMVLVDDIISPYP
jgi:hypothetical protein